MSLSLALSVVPLAACLVLLFSSPARVAAAVAFAAAALELLLALRVVHLSVWHLPVNMILGVILVVAASAAYLPSASKPAVTAATTAVLIGAIQVMRGFHLV
jgi:hypothetical protein